MFSLQAVPPLSSFSPSPHTLLKTDIHIPTFFSLHSYTAQIMCRSDCLYPPQQNQLQTAILAVASNYMYSRGTTTYRESVKLKKWCHDFMYQAGASRGKGRVEESILGCKVFVVSRYSINGSSKWFTQNRYLRKASWVKRTREKTLLEVLKASPKVESELIRKQFI